MMIMILLDANHREGLKMAPRVSTIHPNLVDPRTGGALQAIGIIGGRVVWPVIGGSEGSTEGGSEGQSSEGQTDNEGEGTQTGNEDGTQSDDGQGGSTEGQQTGTISQADFDSLHARMQAADRRASKAENERDELKRKDQSAEERLQSERDDALKEAETLRLEVKNSRIANAFFANSEVTWHNPQDALNMLRADYMDGVEVDDNGKVSGIKEAIKKLAKDKNYLIKKETTSSSADDQMNGKRKGESGNQKAKDEELRRRMPHLSRGQF